MAPTGKAKSKNAGHDTPDVHNVSVRRVEFRPSADKLLPFHDLSDEQYRVYDFGDYQVRLVEPMKLNVSESGGHRVFTANGVSHYIPSGWIHLYWVVKEGCPHFAF